MDKIFLLLALLIPTSFSLQRFERQPEYSEVNPGQEIIIYCKVLNKKGHCSWQKDNKPIGIYLNKYEWASNPDDGDCSLLIKNAQLEYDDGVWECQVTASDFIQQDALSSTGVKLVVRVPPNPPVIHHNETIITSGKNVTSIAGAKTIISCSSRYGNPPGLIKWMIGEEEIKPSKIINKPEEDNSKKWMSIAIIEHSFLKADNAKKLKCVVQHEAYSTKFKETIVQLDVHYPPEVKISGLQPYDIEESTDLVLDCKVDSNPPSEIIWRKLGSSRTVSREEHLAFTPILRKHTGSYSCFGKNYLGSSNSNSVEIDVKFPPTITHLHPSHTHIATLYNRTILTCQSDGNPSPTYQWLQKQNEDVYIRSNENILVINNITYDYEGLYYCHAKNMINGKEKLTASEGIDLKVVGAPQILHHSIEREVQFEKGTKATLTIVFCSNPKYNKIQWNWGSQVLRDGFEVGRFSAEHINLTPRPHCYEAKLHITAVDNSDSRFYYLDIENDYGIEKYSIHMIVRDPVSMAAVVGTILASLILLVVIIIIILYSFKKERLCFREHGDFKPTDLESEKSELGGIINEEKTTDFQIIQSEYRIHRQGSHNTPRRSPIQLRIDPNLTEINYYDLQLPKTSNNGSMRKINKYQREQRMYDQRFEAI